MDEIQLNLCKSLTKYRSFKCLNRFLEHPVGDGCPGPRNNSKWDPTIVLRLGFQVQILI